MIIFDSSNKKFINKLILTNQTVIVLILIAIMYWVLRAQVVSFGDCIAWVESAYQGDLYQTHSVHAHFLYSNFYVFATQLFGNNNVVTIGNSISILSSIFCLFMLYKTAKLFTSKIWLIISGVFLFAFSFSFWRNTEIIEVYTFNLALLSLFFYYNIKFLNTKNINLFWISIVILIVSLLSHIQNILFLPYIGFSLLFVLKDQKLKTILILLFLLLIFFLPTFFIENFNIKDIFLPKKGDLVKGSVNINAKYLFKKILVSSSYFAYNFFVFGLLILFSVISVLRKNPKLFILIVVTILPTILFATFINVTDNYTYFIPIYYLGVLIYIFTFSKIKNLSSNQKTILKYSPIFHIFFYLIIYHTISILPIQKIQEFNQAKSYKGGLEYYLWPGMQNAKSVVDYCLDVQEMNEKPSHFHEFEHMYSPAIRFSKTGKN